MKTSKTKRILTGAMACVMSLSLAVTALAADPDYSNRDTTITGGYEEIPISVIVPETGTAQINPYGLPVEFTKSDTTTVKKITGQQITTAPGGIINQGESDLKVSATAIGVPKGAFKFATSADAVTGKGTEGTDGYIAPSTLANGYVYLQAKVSTAAAGGITNDDAQDVFIDTCTDASWASTYNADKDIEVSTIAATATSKELGTLKAATITSGALAGYPAGSLMAIRLAGVVTESPRTPWAETDGFTVTVSYTFKPVTA